MSVGAGLLLAAASLELAAEAIRVAGPMPAIASLLLGATVFSAANALLARFGAAHRKRCGACTPQASESQHPGSGVAIALGTALDAVPEALVLGLALRERAVPFELVIAITVGNLPEALSGAAGMRYAGRSYRYILLLWGAVALGATVATAGGYAASGSLGQSWPPDKVWAVIGQFNIDWHPLVAKDQLSGTGVGQLRTIETVDGKQIIERLDAMDNAKRFYRYTTISGTPVSNYLGTLAAKPTGSGCTVEWSSKFLADNQATFLVKLMLSTLFKAGLDSLRARFGAAK